MKIKVDRYFFKRESTDVTNPNFFLLNSIYYLLIYSLFLMLHRTKSNQSDQDSFTYDYLFWWLVIILNCHILSCYQVHESSGLLQICVLFKIHMSDERVIYWCSISSTNHHKTLWLPLGIQSRTRKVIVQHATA